MTFTPEQEAALCKAYRLIRQRAEELRREEHEGIIPESVPPTTVYIYGLIDPRDDQIHYVGLTNDPHRREMQHRKDSYSNAAKYLWIRELEKTGLEPTMMILETTDSDQSFRCEQAWITKGRSEGWPLLNGKGGPKGRNIRRTA